MQIQILIIPFQHRTNHPRSRPRIFLPYFRNLRICSHCLKVDKNDFNIKVLWQNNNSYREFRPSHQRRCRHRDLRLWPFLGYHVEC
jgi:hypothetical protein